MARLTALTFNKKPFSWTPEAGQAFQELKQRFFQAPILEHLDPSSRYILEVDASDIGVCAILSQQASQDHKLHP